VRVVRPAQFSSLLAPIPLASPHVFPNTLHLATCPPITSTTHLVAPRPLTP
jgi:hypothetical protein